MEEEEEEEVCVVMFFFLGIGGFGGRYTELCGDRTSTSAWRPPERGVVVDHIVIARVEAHGMVEFWVSSHPAKWV